MKKRLIQYGITTAIGAVMVYLLLVVRGFWELTTLTEKYRTLADAFTIPGVVLMLVAALVWISNEGLFNGISYAAKVVKHMFLPSKQYKHETYYDHVQSRDGKRVKGYGFIFFTGLAFMVVAVVFIILFYQVYVPIEY